MSDRPLVLPLLALAAIALAGPAAAEPTRRALLVGIDQYAAPSLADLAGCGNDVDLMRDLLVGKFEVPPANVRVLKNAEATRAGILAAIRGHLIEPAEDGDVVVFHYSGHGSQMLDASGDELLDGRDETIVPHDSRQGGVFDINDDEINGLMAELSRKTPHVAFVLDSCHSGSASRAAEVGNAVRQVPADLRPPPPPEPFALGARGTVEGPDDFRLPGSGYVLISGCRANELSNEMRAGEWSHGALTWFLAAALRASGERATYRDVLERAASDVSARFPKQHPQIEGTGLDTAVFGVERLPPRPYVLVGPVEAEPGRARVAAGAIFGLAAGDELEVFAPGTKSFDPPAAAVARVRIREVGRLEASADVVSGAVEKESRAPLRSIRPPDFTAGVRLAALPDPALRQALAAALAAHDSVRVVEETAAAQIRVSPSGAGLRLEGRDNETLSEVAAGDRLVERTVERIAHWARWHAILAIDNPSPDLAFDLRLRRGDDPPDAPAPEVVADGAELELTVVNESPVPVHAIVLDLAAADGSVGVMYPPAGIQEQILPGKSIRRRIAFAVGEGRAEDVDHFRAIVTTEAIPAELFELAPVPRDAPEPRGEESALERYLRRTSEGRTRKARPVSTGGWAVAGATVRVVRPGVETRGYAAHFDDAAAAGGAGPRLGSTRAVCGDPPTPDCFELEPVPEEPTMVLIRPPAVRSGERELRSVGTAFEEAYAIARETGAERVEPLLDYAVPVSEHGPHPDAPETRGLADSTPDPRAEGDDRWSLAYTRVPEAWTRLRALGRPEGREAQGVVIAHPDTGFRPHPELVGPLWPERGWDYFGGDDDATDELLTGGFLDNPAHGTGSGSAIVSLAGCQLAGAPKCPTGAAQGARLVPIRVHRSVVHFSTERLTQAILDASGSDRTRVREATDLMSISMGGAPSWALWKAVKRAEQRGYLIVAAAGNYVGTVVWPARFDSVVAVAAVNAGCKPWAYTSAGPAVDFAAPGESVWRGTLGDGEAFVNTMGTGTTYATASTAGIAALWVARHKGTPGFDALRQRGEVARTFRRLAQQTSWLPNGPRMPAAAHCDPDAAWSSGFLGSGIVDAAALLDAPLTGATPGGAAASDGAARGLDELPLWSTLYAPESVAERPVEDYLRLFGGEAALETVAPFEAELTHHYATSERIAAALDQVTLRGDRGDAAFARAREALRAADLSPSLRAALAAAENGGTP